MTYRGGRWLGVWTVVLGLLFASNEARAASAYETDPRTDVFSLTFSPFHLLLRCSRCRASTIQLGVEVLYIHVSTNEPVGESF
jgi:hypothetical protein